jgi:hypothetical protein
MVLPSSGAISVSDVNTELRRPAHLFLFTMNDTDARTLAAKPTPNSPISFSDFYGKSNDEGPIMPD